MLPPLIASTLNTPPAAISAPMPSTSAVPSDARFFTIVDPDIVRENPVEAKHRRLVRGHRTGPLDRELKPNAHVRDELNVGHCHTLKDLRLPLTIDQDILRYPPTQPLTVPQRDLIWRFRFYLCRDKRALTKFLKSVVWTDAGEVKQAVEVLLPSWTDIEMEDALELLGPGEAFRDRRVRGYAVRQIARADDDVRLN